MVCMPLRSMESACIAASRGASSSLGRLEGGRNQDELEPTRRANLSGAASRTPLAESVDKGVRNLKQRFLTPLFGGTCADAASKHTQLTEWAWAGWS